GVIVFDVEKDADAHGAVAHRDVLYPGEYVDPHELERQLLERLECTPASFDPSAKASRTCLARPPHSWHSRGRLGGAILKSHVVPSVCANAMQAPPLQMGDATRQPPPGARFRAVNACNPEGRRVRAVTSRPLAPAKSQAPCRGNRVEARQS